MSRPWGPNNRGVSQPAVSKHLGVLKRAGLVRDRHEGRRPHYSAQLGALAPTGAGVQLRMEQSGFPPDQQQAFQGANGGWLRSFEALERVLASTD